MGRVNYFEMSALDINRAKKFYENIFKWEFEKWDDPSGEWEYYTIKTGPDDEPGINGGISKRQKDNYIVNSIEVKSIDKAIEDIKNNGGKIVTGKTNIGEYGFYAIFEDTEGNLLSIMEKL